MTPAFFAIVLVKTLWLHGLLSDVEPYKWVRPPEPTVTIQVEPSMVQCLADGQKWRLDMIKTALQDPKINNIPLDAINYKCDIILEGGISE